MVHAPQHATCHVDYEPSCSNIKRLCWIKRLWEDYIWWKMGPFHRRICVEPHGTRYQSVKWYQVLPGLVPECWLDILLGPIRASLHPCLAANIFLTSKFSYLLFCNSTQKTETGIANMWELPIANHLNQSLCFGNQK